MTKHNLVNNPNTTKFTKVKHNVLIKRRKVASDKLTKIIVEDMNRLVTIVQWGKERSIIHSVSDLNNPFIIVDNQYLMNLDEMGLVL